MPWLPLDFEAPARVDVGVRHLRPIHPDDTDVDMIAVMGSRKRLWAIHGEARGWPPADMSPEADRDDLARHADEMTRDESFDDALFDTDETRLLGCVYVDPPERFGADAEVSWWVIDELVDTPTDRELAAVVPDWIAARWPFRQPRYVGIELTWAEWLALPEIS